MKRLIACLALLWCLPAHAQSGLLPANQVWAGPSSGGQGFARSRSLVGGDLPNPSASTLGGVKSLTCATSQWLNTISIGGQPACAQPAFTDISGSVACTQEPARTGDVTAPSGSCVNTTVKVNGVSYSAAPSTDTVPIVTAANTTTYTAIANCTAGVLQYSTSTHLFSCTAVLAVANGGTGDSGTAWTTYTPTPACGTGAGTWTVNSARSKSIGKTIFAEFDLTLTAVGTCTGGAFNFSAPNTAISGAGFVGREIVVTGNSVICSIPASGPSISCFMLTSSLASGDRFVGSGVFESN